MAIGTTTQETVRDFETRLRGDLIQPQHEGYEAARTVYNRMIVRRPKFIARCADVADVIAALDFGREAGLPLSVRGCGHNVAGLSVCDGGVVIDLSRMKWCRVEPGKRTVQVGAGSNWGDVDHATHPFGLAVPSGVVSTTGVAGLTLGGGHGHLARKYGLTIDSLLSADMVLADGSFLTVDAGSHPDLFWAIRGGGGNFGIVTSFTFRLHPVKNVVGGPTLWPLEMSADVLRWYRDFIPAAPEDLNGFFAFLVVPPAPPFPESLHLKTMCGIVWCYTGPAERADEMFEPVRSFGPPALHAVHSMPFPALQSAFDALYPPGLQHYWKGDFFRELSDEAIAEHVKHGSEVPTMLSGMHLYPVDGAVHRVGSSDTAFGYRDALWSQGIYGIDPDPANRDRITAWTREYWGALHPFSAGGAYVNFMMEEGDDRVRATYRDNYARLAAVKAEYDPENVFSMNQNIRPATSG